MSWTEQDVPDQSGRIAVITGANSGLGFENARALAEKGAQVIMGVRNVDRGEAARAGILETSPRALAEVRELDLASLKSVETFATSVLNDFDRLDLLINNAGVMAIPERRTEDGFEMQLATNHLGHYALTARLLTLLVHRPGSRVIGVTSTARHLGAPVDPDDPHLTQGYGPWKAYSQSKLANLHFALGLDQRFRRGAAETRSLVAHPGLSRTELQVNTTKAGGGQASERAAHRFGMDPAEGALPQLRAATDPDAGGGEMYAPRWANFGAPVRRPLFGRSTNQHSIDTLFEVSERETGLSIDVASVMEESAE